MRIDRGCLAVLLVIVLLAVTGAVDRAWAWGPVGHAVVCNIAFRELSDAARGRVLTLMKLDKEFPTFAEACNWPDRIADDRDDEHYINVPRTFATFITGKCAVATTCLFTAISADRARLRDNHIDPKKRRAGLRALKYLGHWIGDLHQPLHVSFKDDAGGNGVRTSGVCDSGLHSAWDSCLIRRRLGTDAISLGDTLQREITPTERATWRMGTPRDWANESLAIARRATVGYCVELAGACRYTPNNLKLDHGEDQKTLDVDDAYLDAHAGIVRERLKQAGVRLAHLLNITLGK